MLNDKKHEKIVKILGAEKIAELESLVMEELKTHLVNAECAISEAEKELEANPKFQELKESLKVLSSGMREVRKRQRAIISFIVAKMDDLA